MVRALRYLKADREGSLPVFMEALKLGRQEAEQSYDGVAYAYSDDGTLPEQQLPPRVGGLALADERRRFALRLLEGRPCSQAADDAEGLEMSTRHVLWRELERHPNLHSLRVHKAARRDAHNGACVLPFPNGTPHDTRVAPKLALPQTVADHHDRLGAGSRIRGLDEAASGGTHAEDAKEFSRHHARHDRKGTIAVLHHVRKGAIVLDARHASEHAAPLTQRGKISYGERAQRVVARRFHIDENETLLFLDRKRLQQDSVRDAEHRGRGADADGER